MHNLGTVIKFEIVRTLKKPVFWISVLSFPAMFGIFGFLGYQYQNNATTKHEEQASETFSFEITDKSESVSSGIVEKIKGRKSDDKSKSIEKVKKGETEAYYFIPENLADEKIEIYAKESGFTDNSKYTAVLDSILKNSTLESITKNKVAIVNSAYKVEETNFKDGKEFDGTSTMIAPAIFLAIFYFVIMLLSNQMLTSTTEEKENRVTEMILTSISSRTLIFGKIVSLILLGFIQILILIIPIIVAYLVASNFMDLSVVGQLISNISWSFWPVLTGVIVLIAGLIMFTGLMVGIGSAMPTAKDANSFFGGIIMMLMAPMFFMPAIMSTDPNVITSFISFFPLTSPITLLLRNVFGTLTVVDGIIGLSILVISAVIIIAVAVRIFRYGTLAYGSKVNLKQVFAKK